MKKLLFSIKPFQTDLALLLLRISAGGFMAYAHGWPKLQRLLDGNFSFGDPIGIGETPSVVLAVFAEFFCSILITIGLFTRAALIPAIFTMGVAVFVAHANDPFSDKEHALLFLIPYIALFLLGPGKFSVDKLMGGK